ncbi:enoyl-CoA hydratase-related protein [Marinivivus vitaminiproducens]|uniref:enoyl-CoA hydratase-related protein n=1 Tax=Marinivivus vitaminiproducens TaxID=3035935 RepID=UPI0027A37BC1|nr:enoyl-CoA hydratase-related protein [Geminicoccaceae bacterium SCSIO 64248]
MAFTTLSVTRRERILHVVLRRPERRNALTRTMIDELHAALDVAEAEEGVRLLVLSGEGETFCSGMDFVDAAGAEGDASSLKPTIEAFYGLMERFTTSSTVVVAFVTGRVTAGGVGLVAASDYAIAASHVSFQLSEVVFGLLPATVAPFMIRRCGMQAAFRLSLTAQRIDAERASAIGLVDEVADAPQEALRRFLIRVARLDPGCVAELKGLFRDMWIVNDETRRLAVEAITRRILEPKTALAIQDFMQQADPSWRT